MLGNQLKQKSFDNTHSGKEECKNYIVNIKKTRHNCIINPDDIIFRIQPVKQRITFDIEHIKKNTNPVRITVNGEDFFVLKCGIILRNYNNDKWGFVDSIKKDYSCGGKKIFTYTVFIAKAKFRDEFDISDNSIYIDHINRNDKDNRFSNIRMATARQNAQKFSGKSD